MSFVFAWHTSGIIGGLLVVYTSRCLINSLRGVPGAAVVGTIAAGLLSGTVAAFGVALLLTTRLFAWMLFVESGTRGFIYFWLSLIVASLMGLVLSKVSHLPGIKFMSVLTCAIWLAYPVWYLWLKSILKLIV